MNTDCTCGQNHDMPPPRRQLTHIVARTAEGWRQEPSWEIIEAPPDWFTMIETEGKRMTWLKSQGIDAVDYHTITKAISVRQPWATALLNEKDIENRSRRICPPGWYYLHAGQAFSAKEWEAFTHHCVSRKIVLSGSKLGYMLPRDYITGGIIGVIQITGWTPHSESKWFVGPLGAEIGHKIPLPLIRCPGQLGAFTPKLP